MDPNTTVDASLVNTASIHSSRKTKKVSVEKVQEIEREMDIYQKVSLVFLLYSDLDLALQRLQAVEAHLKSASQSSLSEISLLYDWACAVARKSGEKSDAKSDFLPDECGMAFVEALSIAQDYESLCKHKLGDRNSGILARETSLDKGNEHFVNHARNVLYRLCEDLHPKVSQKLVQRVESERPDLARHFLPDARLLEVTILHWASRGYIKITQENSMDVRNIIRHLSEMGELKMAEFLEKHLPYKKEPLKSEQSTVDDSPKSMIENEPLFNPYTPSVKEDISPAEVRIKEVEEEEGAAANEQPVSLPFISTIKKFAKTDRNVIYDVNPDNMGYCVIVNQKNFYMDGDLNLQPFLPHSPFEDRLGTDVDRDRLVEAFTSLGFKIIVKTNLTHHQLLDFAHQLAGSKELKRHSSLVFCILSHGQKDVVYGCNSVPVNIMDLVEIFCGSKCPALINKPKIFIIQACQGSKLQQTKVSNLGTDGPTKSLAGVKDYVKFLSTVPGYVSLRHKVKGSWFIDTLSEEIMCREPNCSLLDVFTQVNASVDKKSSVVGNSMISMMSELRTTLRGPLYLPLEHDTMKKATLLSIQRALFEKLLEEFYDSDLKNPKRERKTKWYQCGSLLHSYQDRFYMGSGEYFHLSIRE